MKRFTILLLLILPVSLVFSQATTKPKAKTTQQSATKKPAGATKGKSTDKKGDVPVKPGKIAADKIDTFKLQVIPLVKFFESSLNFLTDKRNSVGEKKTIITQSYLKWCWDPEVQVEDDLDENRLVPLYKDMPAYLTDVDFFFKQAKFKYDIQDISVETTSQGYTFFKVTANRNLNGVLVTGDSVNSNKVRYIEINYDSVKQQLKIVSVYTTKLNEKDDMRNWWNTLPLAWKKILGSGKELAEGISLDQIESFNDTVALIGGTPTPIDGSLFYQSLTSIIRADQLDLSGDPDVLSLEPVSKLSELTVVNIAGTKVTDLMPLRNMNKLADLNISRTGVSTIDPLRYCSQISRLNISRTLISDLSVVSTYQLLEQADISGTRDTSLIALAGMTKLKRLSCSRMDIRDLSPLSDIKTLEVLDFSATKVKSLEPLKGLTNLQEIHFDSTAISDLSPLDGITTLSLVFCNNSGVGQKEALAFLQQHPGVSLIYETKSLSEWWAAMSQDWHNTFSLTMTLSDPPTSGELHKLILNDSINITGRMSITTLDPLKKLILLENLQCKSSGISDLTPLKDLSELKILNVSNTAVASVEPLKESSRLELLNLDFTGVGNVSPLAGLENLRIIYADNSKLDFEDAISFADQNKGCVLVCQTAAITDWWNTLDKSWKEVLARNSGAGGTPDKLQFARIAMLDSVDVTENFQITDLQPLTFLKRLRVLRFTGTGIANLEPATRMASLRVLRFPGNPKITDLTPLNSMTKLKELDFSTTQVEDLEALQNMVKLEVLKFNNTRVKNLKYLEKLVNLTDLEFANTRANSIDVCYNMKKLKSLKIFNTSIREKKVEEFKAANPGCEVVFFSK